LIVRAVATGPPIQDLAPILVTGHLAEFVEHGLLLIVRVFEPKDPLGLFIADHELVRWVVIHQAVCDVLGKLVMLCPEQSSRAIAMGLPMRPGRQGK